MNGSGRKEGRSSVGFLPEEEEEVKEEKEIMRRMKRAPA